MVQTDDGQWRLGPAAGWLGARYQAGFDVNNVRLHLAVQGDHRIFPETPVGVVIALDHFRNR